MKSNIKITFDQLIIIDAIVQYGSFTAAAEHLHRVPSTISYTITRLEEDLGVQLFRRVGRSVELTEAGEELVRQGRYLIRYAEDAQRSVQSVATGWESELRIAVSDITPEGPLIDLLQAFQEVAPRTRIRISTEVLAGGWDALVSGRADLVIGNGGDPPSVGGIAVHPMGEVEFRFVVPPDHPLAEYSEALTEEHIRPYTVVAVADTSRDMPVRTTGIVPGQHVLTVPHMRHKIAMQLRGLAVGSLPVHMITSELAEGRLIPLRTAEGDSRKVDLYYAWRSRDAGNGLKWFVDRLTGPDPIDWFA